MHFMSNLGKLADILLMNIRGSRKSGHCHAALNLPAGFGNCSRASFKLNDVHMELSSKAGIPSSNIN